VEGLQKEWEGKVEENFDWILKEVTEGGSEGGREGGRERRKENEIGRNQHRMCRALSSVTP
jgi:hypothetical protein